MNSRIITILLFSAILTGSLFAQAFDPSQLAGHWRGTWFNNTFSSTDSAFLDISYDGSINSLTMVLDLNGNVFGGSDPAPANMSGTYDQNGFGISGNSPTYGDMFFNGDASGNVIGRMPNVPNPNIDSTTVIGTYTSTNIDLTYLVYFTGGAGTADGVIHIKKDNPTDIQLGDVSPSDFRLYQNYPNPFNPETTINFSLSQSEWVQINIYSVTGEKVMTLINDNFNAGQHHVKFYAASEGKNLASGIYFYTLETSGFKDAKKMILMK